MTDIPFLDRDDLETLNRLCVAVPDTPDQAFVTFVLALGKDPARDYRAADLRDYELPGQDLAGVDVTGADLRGADLRGTRGFDPGIVLMEGAVTANGRRAGPDEAARWLIRWATLRADGKYELVIAEIEDFLARAARGWSEVDVEGARRHLAAAGRGEAFDTVQPGEMDVAEIVPERTEEAPVSERVESADNDKPSFWRNLLTTMPDIAISLGTSNIVIYRTGRGVVLNEPSVIAAERHNGVLKIEAAGDEAKLMIGKMARPVAVIRPFADGIVSDAEAAAAMIKYFLRKAERGQRRFRSPQIAVSVPSGSTSVERREIRDVVLDAGASQVWLIEKSMAAAIGAGLPVAEAVGSMVVDIGAGTTDVAVITERQLAYTMSVRTGGDRMDEAIVSYVRRNHNLLIGEATAERIKQEVGTAKPPADGYGHAIHIKGRDLVNGVPKEIQINQGQLAEALSEPVGTIVEGVRIALENCAPELADDIVAQGIVLTGGGALLHGIDDILRDETGLPVTIAEDPLTCGALGIGRAMEDPAYRSLLSSA